MLFISQTKQKGKNSNNKNEQGPRAGKLGGLLKYKWKEKKYGKYKQKKGLGVGSWLISLTLIL